MSGIRMTGLVSGLDTESIVEQLMEAQRTKLTKVENKQTKLTWKQEKWKDLNTKLLALYKDEISNLRLQGSYKTAKVSSSNESLITATAKNNAPTGTQTVEVLQLASSQNVTGSKISSNKDINGNSISTSTKFSELDSANSFVGTEIKVTAGDKVQTITITQDTKISDFLTTCQNAGLSASYDEKQGRFFISSKSSGEENAFTITTAQLSQSDLDNRSNFELAVNYDSLSSSDKTAVDQAYNTIRYSSDATEIADAKKTLTDYAESAAKNNTQSAVTANMVSYNCNQILADSDKMSAIRTEAEEEKREALTKQYTKENKDKSEEEIATMVDEAMTTEEIQNEIIQLVTVKVTTEAHKMLEAQKASGIEINGTTYTFDGFVEQGMTEDFLINEMGLSSETAVEVYSLTDCTTDMKTILNDSLDYAQNATAGASSSVLSKLGLGEIDGTTVSGGSSGMTVVAAADSKISLNGAIIEGTSNSITANGVTYNLKGVTNGETVTLNVSTDIQGTYDMIKEGIKKYNEILKEMNTLYYAASAKGYEPLTDDEKDAMTDDQIEKWETKIKDSLLRRDTTLGGIITSMKNAMSSSVEIDGKRYSLSTFGITTSSDYTEKGLLHIYGDPDDSTYSDKKDKLYAALESNPDETVEALSTIFGDLYSKMSDKMKSSSLSSTNCFYNDKQLSDLADDYKDDYKTLSDRLDDMEDRYYKQFSAMETALANLQSQQSALSSLLGTSA